MAAEDNAPAFLVYMFGHLRTFRHISHRQRQQFDTIAAGKPYLVFLHTWSETDHNRPVWWRDYRQQWRSNASVPKLIADPESNGLRDVMAESLIEEHPGLTAAIEWNVTLKDRKVCLKNGETCVSDAVQQLDELGRTHRMAAAYMRKHWRGRMGKRWLRSLPVIKTRPDVTIRTNLKDEYTADYSAPIETISELAAKMSAVREKNDGHHCIFGYRGPWMGGWGDLVFAARFDAMEAIVDGMPRLGGILSQPSPPVHSLPPFNERLNDALSRNFATGRYRAEMVLMHYLLGLGVVPSFHRFCHVARHRPTATGDAVGKIFLHMC